jgi:hypothetical protein
MLLRENVLKAKALMAMLLKLLFIMLLAAATNYSYIHIIYNI